MSQDHSREAAASQQVPYQPQSGQFLLQEPSSEAGGAAGKPLHCCHQVRTCS